MNPEQELATLCDEHGLTFSMRNPTKPGESKGPITLRASGSCLVVDWWPYSRKRTAYVLGTKSAVSKENATALDVVLMATAPPPANIKKPKRNFKIIRAWKRSIWKIAINKGQVVYCNWCSKPLTRLTVTADHRIPLHRGGLDNMNNLVPACELCNTKRGHDMPELTND